MHYRGNAQGSTSPLSPQRASRDCISPPQRGAMGLGPWANPRLMVTQLVMEEAHGPVAPPFGGEYSRERLVEGQPRWPPLTSGFVLVSFTGKFADILVIDWPVN